MENARLTYLFKLQLSGKATSTEQEELRMLMARKENEAQVKQMFNDEWASFEPGQEPFDKNESRAMLQNILRQDIAPVRRIGMLVKIAAAVVIVLLSVVLYFFINNKSSTGTGMVSSLKEPAGNEVVPGGDKALLTLADGTVIILDSVSNGTIASNENFTITKTAGGKVIYNPKSGAVLPVAGGAGTNTMSTPRGGQYKLRLPDGTDAWLNAASSISYPVAFSGNERKVEITGEVYFEVAKNAKMPFKVVAKGTEIQVLGTHFNVNAYPDEAVVQTTLVEGSVLIARGNASAMLVPGQQANIDADNKLTVIEDADMEECLAWKNGFFIFRATNIRSIMRQVSRWYDVEVDYELPTDKLEFSGAVSRKDHVSEILKIMELTDLVHFKIEGKKITVVK